jgi:DnaJ like chaperone protein
VCREETHCEGPRRDAHRRACELPPLALRGVDVGQTARRHLSPAADDPWAVLGVEPGADAAALRGAYHALVKRYHPDRALAEGVPSEFIRVSELRMADINAAYDRLTGRRR